MWGCLEAKERCFKEICKTKPKIYLITKSLIGQMIKKGFRNFNEEYIPRSVINDAIKIWYNKRFRKSNDEYRRQSVLKDVLSMCYKDEKVNFLNKQQRN